MAIVPDQLDFGQLVSGYSVNRTVRLSETMTDRFRVESVDVGQLPVKHLITQKQNAEGLSDYLLRFTLLPDDVVPGRHAAVITIKTNSRLVPGVRIPIRFHVESQLRTDHQTPLADLQSIVVAGGVSGREVDASFRRSSAEYSTPSFPSLLGVLQ